MNPVWTQKCGILVEMNGWNECIYIYIYIGCLTDFECDHPLSFMISFFLLPFLGCMHRRWIFKPAKLRQMLPQTGHCRALWLQWISLYGVVSWTSKWETEFSTFFTIDVVTLWIWCWSLFTLRIDRLRPWIQCPHESVCATNFYPVSFFPLVHRTAEKS